MGGSVPHEHLAVALDDLGPTQRNDVPEHRVERAGTGTRANTPCGPCTIRPSRGL
jgi:hypothetical protein